MQTIMQSKKRRGGRPAGKYKGRSKIVHIFKGDMGSCNILKRDCKCR